MPIFEYVPDSGECEQCEGRFEVFQKAHLRDLHLKHCPTCGQACHRVVSSFAAPVGKDLFGDSRVADAGLVKYKRVGRGEYERVGQGPGPRVLSEETLSNTSSAPTKE
ncbi:MAG: zinc ribbon domain-containing protein [Myxococcota bacterium]